VKGDRGNFQEHLTAQGIQCAIHYPLLIPDQPALRGQPYAVDGELKNARLFAEKEVSLPIHPFMSDDDIERVVVACKSWAKA
jgi:dTDP-3-amino-3,4,6-trideoxy-alpha-D-glucose transaminase